MHADPRTRRAESLHVIGLSTLAVAQPVLGVLGRNGQFFVSSRSSSPHILLLVAVLVVGCPFALLLVEAAAGLAGVRARRAVHLAIVAALCTAILIPLAGRWWNGPGVTLVLLGGLAGVAATVAYVHLPPVRLFLSFMAAAPLVVAANFLFNSDATRLLMPASQPSAAAVVDHGGDAGDVDHLRRTPAGLASRREPPDRRRAIPQLRGARCDVTLVQEHDVGVRWHGAGRSRHPHRTPAPARSPRDGG